MPAHRPDFAETSVQREALLHSQLVSLRERPDRRNHESREALLRRVRAEFEEMRGLNLTFGQARRLFGMRDDVCVRVLSTLICEGLLRLTPDCLFARRRIDA